ncbi:putative membrane protein, putative Na+channel or pump [Streptococcus criceti]|uniref:Membrane protein n=1 Tax=Streptococcus criceti HS-6 TaxID=873449 RepID=G5JTQ5_STRCG|nr:DUF554 domain-containing protein [Streptococcus criceti]EHI75153.1 putative membrane protein [Streptococcus criceti HS-6]SUN37721.1 putative membrane protein, putative Na+channel or pump [Streptococcus criceti]
MPLGVIVNSLSIILGGLLGGLFGHHLDDTFKEKMNMIFGVCSMGMGITSITKMSYMPAVVFAVVLGTIVGLLLDFDRLLFKGGFIMQRYMSKVFPKQPDMPRKQFLNALVTVIVLFCASGTGIYGSLVNGMTGDASILISKSILDFFTAAIFACNLGYVVAAIALPQFVIFTALFYLAGIIVPLTTPAIIGDFTACGGFLMVATGFRIIQVKMFPTADMIPAMVLVMPISWFWITLILPLL